MTTNTKIYRKYVNIKNHQLTMQQYICKSIQILPKLTDSVYGAGVGNGSRVAVANMSWAVCDSGPPPVVL